VPTCPCGSGLRGKNRDPNPDVSNGDTRIPSIARVGELDIMAEERPRTPPAQITRQPTSPGVTPEQVKQIV